MGNLPYRSMLAAAALLLTTGNANAAGIWFSENGTAPKGPKSPSTKQPFEVHPPADTAGG